MRNISVADYFVEFLIANGVTDVFGYQGGMIAYIFDSLGKYRDKINYHSCATEQGAALAACAFAQASKKIGVAISTSGPGFTNLITGMADAWFDSIPVLFVSGNVNTKDKKREKKIRQLGFQEIQAAAIAGQITKRSYEIELDTDYAVCFEEAYRAAMTSRKGPVYLDLPINVCREYVHVAEIDPIQIEEKKLIDISYIVEDLMAAKKPIIIAGAGIKQANMVKVFRRLIDILQIPVITTLPAIDVLPSGHESMLGYIGGTARREAGIALQNADYVLSIGTRLCSKQIGHDLKLFAPKADKFVRIDIDGNEFCRQLKDNEFDIQVNIEDALPSMINYLEKIRYKQADSSWLNSCRQMQKLLSNIDITEGNRLYRDITLMFPAEANILLDVGKNMTYGGQSAIIKEQTQLYMSAGLGTMGYAIPAAIGAFYGNKKPTFVFTGDGGAQMNIQELNTIVKNNLPIKIFVLNNKALGNIRIFQEQYLNSRFVATSEKEGDYYSCNFNMLAKAYGMESFVIKNMDEMKSYEEYLYSDEAVLFEIIYEDCPVLPGIVAGGEFLKEGTGIEQEIIDKIYALMT